MHRKLFFMEDGEVGLGPAAMGRHDEVWVVAGGGSPLVLRRALEGKYRLVGEGYVLSLQELVTRWRHATEDMLEGYTKILLI
jgi:hypothetical protein